MTSERAGLCRCGHTRNEHDEAGYGICEFDGWCDCVKFDPVVSGVAASVESAPIGPETTS